MGISPTPKSMETTLIVRAVAAPLIAAAVTAVYYRFFGCTAPLQTTLIFLSSYLTGLMMTRGRAVSLQRTCD